MALLLWLAIACGRDETCTFTLAGDGATRMVCPGGGDAILLEAEGVQPPGGIRGVVRRFGRKDHSDIEVQLVGGSRSTVTDETGYFEIDRVDAGHHSLTVRATAYEETTVRDILVLPGRWTTGEVELRSGRMLAGGSEWVIHRSPRDETFLAVGGGNLLLIDPAAARSRAIASSVLEDARFSPDGAWVIYRVQTVGEVGGRLWFYDVDTRRKTEVASHVVRWALTGDRASFVYEREVEELAILETWHQPTGRRATVSGAVRSWRVAPDGSALVARVGVTSGAGVALVVWDLAAAGGTSLGASLEGDLPAFGPDRRSFVFLDGFGDLMLWDGGRSEVVRLAGEVSFWRFAPGGEAIAWIEAEGSELVHFDLETRTRFSIRLDVLPFASFSPDGGELAYVRSSEEGTDLFVWSRETRASRNLGRIEGIPEAHGLSWSPDGEQLFVFTPPGNLYRWRAPSLEALTSDAQALPRFAPDGKSFLFHEGARLQWAPIDGGEPVALEAPVRGYPVRWSPELDRLLFVTARVDGVDDFGNAWLFTPATSELKLVSTDVHLQRIDFVEDGSLLALERYDRTRSNRGTLELDGEPLATGVRDGYDFTPDARRAAFICDAFEIAEESVLALWRRADGEHGPGDELVPLDSSVTAQLVGDDWVMWVTEAENRTGLYVSHYPADLPAAPAGNDAPIAGGALDEQETDK